MKYRLFLFDLDDTLLDFRASERLSFLRTLQALGLHDAAPDLFAHYQAINVALWRSFELGTVTKEFLKVERFRQTFARHALDLDPAAASALYLESLSDTVVLIDGAAALCATLAAVGEVGIVTNGVDAIQRRRIASSGLDRYVSFVCTSEACGYAKPDLRFFEYAASLARPFAKLDAIVVGDRLDADILGANRYGVDSCWYNPDRAANASDAVPTFDVGRLEDVAGALRGLRAA